MKKKVAIVIPIYKRNISKLEKISLNQCLNIFLRYDKFFVMPYSLDYTYQSKNIKEIRLNDKWFENVQAYNNLMLNKKFYDIFVEYEYILIYQLDAFVFEDKLMYFCNLEYDYIGAPWLAGLQYYLDSKHMIWHVGNGGFSLRNVCKCIQLIDQNQNPYRESINEDVFFSIGNSNNFKVAPVKIALEFAFESEVNTCFETNGYELPFGCHAWEKYNLEFWKPYIEYYGYKIDNVYIDKGRKDIANSDLYVSRRENAFFWKHIFNKTEFKRFIEEKQKKIYIWGAGRKGRFLGKLFNECLINIEGYLDNKTGFLGEYIENYKIVPIENYERNIDNAYVIIATDLYYNDISKQLNKYGCIYSKDFIFYMDILKILTEEFQKRNNKLSSSDEET